MSILEDQVLLYNQKSPYEQKSFLPIQKFIFDYNPKTLKFAYMQNSTIYLSKLSQEGQFLVQENNDLILKAKNKKYIFGLCMAKDTSDYWAIGKRKKILVLKGKEIIATVPRPGGIFESTPIDGMAVNSKWLIWVAAGKLMLYDMKKKKLTLKAEMALLKVPPEVVISCFIDETLGPMCITANHDLFYCGPEGSQPRHRNLWEEYVRVTIEKCEKAQEVLASVNDKTEIIKVRVPFLPLCAVKVISAAIYMFSDITTLEIHGLSSSTAIELARGLNFAVEAEIQSLSLHGSSIGMKGFEAIAEFLRSEHCVIQTLSLTNSGLSHNSMAPIANAMKKNKTITSLTLSCNDLLQQGAMSVSEMIRENKVIQHLDLYGCKLSEQGSAAILEALCENPNILYLELDRNILATLGETAVGKYLVHKNCHLKTLNLSQSRIRPHNLLSSLALNTSLRSLDLSYNILDDNSVDLLCEALKSNKFLQKLNLSHCGLNETSAKKIIQYASASITVIRFFMREVGNIQHPKVKYDTDYT